MLYCTRPVAKSSRYALEVRLLGTFRLESGGHKILLASRPAQSLLAYLMLNAGIAHRREKLAGQLWPDTPEISAHNYLRQALWRIRKALQSAKSAELLQADDLSVAFASSGGYLLDAEVLRRAAEGQSADELMQGVRAYGGELLPGFYDEWVELERAHLQAIYEEEMARLLVLLQQSNRWQEILEWAERWISFGHKPEPAYRALMAAHAAHGDLSSVAATYDRCMRALGELGFEPSEDTRALYQAIKSGTLAGMRQAAPAAALRSEPAPTNIPVPLTSFVGRERERKRIAGLLTKSRLVTLTGLGGVGKTRLALRAASDSVTVFRDGVSWISLVGLADPDLIPYEIAQALEVREAPPEPLLQTLIARLKTRQCLLVLDNCEHLIEACAQLVEKLLSGCPSLRILATSVEGLGLFNETIFQVPPLPLPADAPTASLKKLKQNESINLFNDRAAYASSGFSLDKSNAAEVIEICRHLDGIPLAIELAAARMKVLSVQEIARRLDDRFALLTSGSRTAIPRHQTLRAAIDWSHDLLGEPERILFRRLAIFAGGFSLEAAEVICAGGLAAGEALDLLGHLASKSLIEARPAEDGESRYQMLETLRQYAAEKLSAAGEEAEVRQRHLDFFVQLAEQAEPNIYAHDAAAWFRRLRQDLDNLRAATDWATTSGRADLALRLLSSIVEFSFVHGIAASEWTDRVERALQQPEGKRRTLTRAKALTSIGYMSWADPLPRDRHAELEEAVAIATELGDRHAIASALAILGLVDGVQGHLAEARLNLEKSLRIWRELGPDAKVGTADALLFLGDVLILGGEPVLARASIEESIALWMETGDSHQRGYGARRLAQLAWRAGDLERAFTLCRESLELNRSLGDPRAVCACLAGFAAIRLHQGDIGSAAVLAASMEAELQRLGIRLLYMDRLEYEQTLTEMRAGLAPRKLEQLWAKGLKMSLEKATALALRDG